MWSLWAWARRTRALVSADVTVYRMISESALWWLQYSSTISESAAGGIL